MKLFTRKYWREFLAGFVFTLGILLILGTGPGTVQFPNSLSYGVTLGPGGEYHSTTAIVDINNPSNGVNVSNGALSTALLGTSPVSLSTMPPPSSLSNIGITPIVSTGAEASHVFKASSGNLYSAYVTVGSTAGYLMIFNAISVPVDGVVAPIQCIPVASNQTTGLSFGIGPPEVYSIGITAVFSSTGCFTKTASATAFFHGSVQ